MLKIKSFTFNPFSENTFVVSDQTGSAVIVDPGCYNKAEEAELVNYIEKADLRVEKILNTHCHIDHIFGNDFAVKQFKAPLGMPEKDMYNLQRSEEMARLFQLNLTPSPQPDFLIEGESLTFGQTTFKILFTPGHCSGHVSFYHEPSANIFSGDVLFQGSIGRTDLPGGSFEVLMNSIHEELMVLPDKVVVHCGHGPSTTIGQERNSNPFVLGLMKA